MNAGRQIWRRFLSVKRWTGLNSYHQLGTKIYPYQNQQLQLWNLLIVITLHRQRPRHKTGSPPQERHMHDVWQASESGLQQPPASRVMGWSPSPHPRHSNTTNLIVLYVDTVPLCLPACSMYLNLYKHYLCYSNNGDSIINILYKYYK